MLCRHLLVFVLAFHFASAFWPFSESSDDGDDSDDGSVDDTSYYFNTCLDTYKCETCYKIKKAGKCGQYMRECRKTCSSCEAPDSDRYGEEKCQYYKKQGYCHYPSFKYFKCQKTCSSCEVDGNWGQWSSWNDCSKSCGGGNQTRKRECNNPKPAYGGKACANNSEDTRACNTEECPIDGNWGEWSEWSACTKSCKQGQQSRTRKCNSPAPQYGGNNCEGESIEKSTCNENVPCPIDGNWGEWSEWSTCTKTCKEGKQSRSRECNSPAPQYGGKDCDGPSSQKQVCNQNVPCPVDGNWGEWSEWSTCSKTCKQGNQTRTRECNSPAPQYGGKGCDGKPKETQICNDNVPCPVDGNWGEWSEWSTCTKTCKQGKQSRKRECNSPAPQYGGKECEGQAKERQICNENVPCPIDGNWGEWSEWSTCTKTCKQGKQSRTRECNSPAPQYGGNDCDGEAKESQICNENVPCPVDGNWGEWSEWSTCSKTCKQGNQTRTRECNAPAPQYGGQNCDGEAKEAQTCNENVPCPVDGNWGEWSEWSTCTKTCKQGKQTRKRECNSPAPQYGGNDCDGQAKESQICNENVPCPVDGNWGEWSEWSTCTKTCKQGNQTRTRECNAPAPQYGGKNCDGQAKESQICNENVPCPVDGNWGEWSEWSTCSKTCKQGNQTRTRECNSPAPQYGGQNCDGQAKESQICNENVPCPVDGNWGEWSEWSTCTKTCKQGKQSRKRECNSPAPQYGGNACDGLAKESQICNENVPCPVDGNWGEWSEWSTCSKTCRQGNQTRTRECNAPAPQYGGKNCDGEAKEAQICNENVPCPVDGNWGEWSEWSTCTKTCKAGKQSRTRECNSPAPQYGGKECDGRAKESQICNQDVPCPVDGNWGEWSEWSTCTKTCKHGVQSRTRECNSPAPQYGGNDCDGEANETRICNHDVPCPVDGNWSEWSEWSTCSKTCKQGKQSRTRECNNPAPQYGGQDCEGNPEDTRVCNEDVPCPVDGNWGEWGEWNACSKTCKQGKQSRSRECDSPVPQYGGKDCDGNSEEVQPCNENVPCPVDGSWGEWSEWSTCSKTCKEGQQTRTRECSSPAPQYGGKTCEGDANQTQVCNSDVPCPVNGNWGEWGAWSQCSKTCGGGEHSRTRECNNPAPAYGGEDCVGAFRQRQPCNQDDCPVDGNWGEWSAWSTCSKTCKEGKQSRTRECNSPKPKYGGKHCEGNANQTITCNVDVPCPVDGMWGSWTAWTACSATCGYGTRERKRLCDSPKPAHNGASCVGIGYQKRKCHAYYPCPINGNWTSWGEWSPCTKTCGLSYRKRSRSCTNPPPEYGGTGCDGQNDQIERCTAEPCYF